MTVRLNQLSVEGAAAGPHLLITGGVHGDEFEPLVAIRRLASLLNSTEQLANSLHGRVTLVPCVNEEAFLAGQRCASDGLDLARTCPGRADGSITEQTAWALSDLIQNADYYIDLHTGGTEFSISPLAGYVLHPRGDVLEAQRLMARAFNLPIIWGTSAELEGRSLSVARDHQVPAIYCEYLGSATCSDTGIDAYVNGCLNVMAALNMIDRPAPPSCLQWTVEDPRPASGHLQVCHPSPIDGYFEPAVQLGAAIGFGSALGRVVSLRDDSSHIITAEHSGIVLMLRTFPRVRAGASVGVVLETSQEITSD